MKTLLLLVFRSILRAALGLHRTPKVRPPCIVVSNHNTMFDVYALTMVFPLGSLSRVRCGAAADTFARGFLGWFARATLNPILIHRTNDLRDRDPLRRAREALQAGDSLIFFPEGTRGEPGVMIPFKAGIGELSRSAPGIPIYPCFIAGIERVWPRGEWLPLPFNVEVLVGEPYLPAPDLGPKEIALQLEGQVRALATRYEKARQGEEEGPTSPEPPVLRPFSGFGPGGEPAHARPSRAGRPGLPARGPKRRFPSEVSPKP